jgi:hypothetical protein
MSKLNAKSLAEAIAAALAPVLVAAFGGTAAASNDADEGEETQTEKKGRGRPVGSTKTNKAETNKADTKSAKGKAKDEEEEEEDDDGLGDDDLGLGDEEEEVTQEDVVNAFKALKSSKGIEKCREVLAKLDESNVLNIPPKKYAEALKEINRAGSKK